MDISNGVVLLEGLLGYALTLYVVYNVLWYNTNYRKIKKFTELFGEREDWIVPIVMFVLSTVFILIGLFG